MILLILLISAYLIYLSIIPHDNRLTRLDKNVIDFIDRRDPSYGSSVYRRPLKTRISALAAFVLLLGWAPILPNKIIIVSILLILWFL